MNMRGKWVWRHDPGLRMLRVGRVMWERGTVGDGKGYSAKLSLAFWPRLFRLDRTWQGWDATLLGVRVHYQRAYGGIHV